MRKFKGKDTARLQQNLEPLHKIVQIRYLRQYVVAKHEISATSVRREFFSQSSAKELYECRNSLFAGHLGDIRSGLDSQHRDLPFREVLQQVPVIAGHFYRQTLLMQAKPRNHLVAIVRG